jgi:hypothetical protein
MLFRAANGRGGLVMFRSCESFRHPKKTNLCPSAVSIVWVVLALCLSSCSKHGISGEYLASTVTKVDRLQLVETPGGHLSGQFEVSVLTTNGKVQYAIFAVTGATDDSNVSLSLKPSDPLLPSVEMSGTLSWEALTLTGGISGGQSREVVMRQSDLDQYHAALAALRERSVAIVKAQEAAAQQAAVAAQKAAIAANAAAMREKVLRDQQSFARDVEKLCDKMQKFEASGSASLQKFPSVAARYRAITAKMQNYLQRDRTLAGISNATYARGQISYAVSNGIYATSQVHFEVKSLQDNFVSNIEPQMRSAETAMRICSNTSVPVPTVDPACAHLKSLYPTYSNAYHDVAAGLADLESTYQVELKKQQELQTEAGQIN